MRTKGLRANGTNPRALGTNPVAKGTNPLALGISKRGLKPKKPRAECKRVYSSREWFELRYEVLKRSKGRCELCGCGPNEGVHLQVDHIKPISKYPELELDPDNLQVLCRPCNMGKSNRDETDWRQQE